MFAVMALAATTPPKAQAQRHRPLEPMTEANYLAAERFSPTKVRQMVYTLEVQPNWFERSNGFWYSYRTSEGTRWWIVDPVRATKRPLFDNDRMAADLTRILRDPYDGQNLPVRDIRFTADETSFRFTVESKFEEVEERNEETGRMEKRKKRYVFDYNINTNRLTHLEDYKTVRLANWGSVSPDGRQVVYAKDFDLWIMDWDNYLKASENERDSTIVERQLTFDGERSFAWGGDTRRNSNDNLEREARRRRGANITWSPDSKNFIVGRNDSREVKELWVIHNIARPRPTLETYRYSMPGDVEVMQYYLYIYNLDRDEMRFIETDAFKDQVVGIVNDRSPRIVHDDFTVSPRVWMGDNREFFFTRMSRDFRRMDICRVDVETLTVRPIIEERFNTYLEQRGIQLTDGAGSDIIHWSERDGWAHLYLYSWDGQEKRQITSGAWHVERVVHVDPRQRVIYFIAQGREPNINPYYTFLYRVNFDGSNLRLLTPGDMNHEVSMHEQMRFFVNNFSRNDMTPETALFDVTGRRIMHLETADLSRLFEAGYKFPRPYRVKAADGITDLYGTMYLPFDMDSTRSYPIIEYVYPGPQTEGIIHKFHAPSDRFERLAQMGFVVVTTGNRGGHPSRSRWYHTFGYGNLRDYGLADKKAIAIQLADRHPFIDITRVGITGHSGGGFMSTAAILQYPDFFKVAVSAAGNHDNSIYNHRWSEKHHGILEIIDEQKQDTTFRFSIANNQSLARNLEGRLMLVTGDVDNNVHPAGTILVIDALIRAGKRFDMLILPGEAHSFRGVMQEYYFWRTSDYFAKYLLGDYQNTVNIPQMRETEISPPRDR